MRDMEDQLEDCELLVNDQPRYGTSDDGASNIGPDTPQSANSNDGLFGLSEHSKISEFLWVYYCQATPVVVAFFLQYYGTFISLLFCGMYYKNDNTVFAGISLAVMFANITSLSVMTGLSSAVETLGSQNNGAGNYKEVGIVLQRSFLILGLFVIPIVCIWQFTFPIFSHLGIERPVCVVMQKYLSVRALCVPCDAINQSYERYLMAIGVMKPCFWAGIIFNVFLAAFIPMMMFGLKLDYTCLAWAWVIASYLSASIMIGLSLKYSSVGRTLQPWNKKALKHWLDFLQLGLPGTIMLCSEWWAFEILTLFASLLGTNEVTAETIVIQIATLAFMIPYGIGITCGSLVGNSLGASKTILAVRIGNVGLGLIVFLEIIIGFSVWLCGSTIIKLFSTDPAVFNLAISMIIFTVFLVIADGLQGVGAGILRGAGKQFIGALTNVIAFYVLGLPIAWVLCFYTSLGVNGLVVGITVAVSCQALVLLVIIFGYQDYVFSQSREMQLSLFSAKNNPDGY